MNPFYDAYETSLSKLDEHHWNILSSRWSRGIDWMVQKVGKRHWEVIGFPTQNAGFPLFKTKTAAYDAATNLILMESRWRMFKRYEEDPALRRQKEVAIPT